MKKSLFMSTVGLVALSGAILLTALPAHSQAAATRADPAKGQPEEPRISLDIQQGVLQAGGVARPATVANVVQVLQGQLPDANFVLSPGVSEVVISNLTLRSAHLDGALIALSYATGNKMRASPVGKDNSNIYAFIAGPAPRPEKDLEVFNLSPSLDSLGPRDSKAVHERAREISNLIIKTIDDFDARTKQEHGQPLLNFHPDTGLLVVIGHPAQLEIAGKIVKALNPPVRTGVHDLLELKPDAKKSEN